MNSIVKVWPSYPTAAMAVELTGMSVITQRVKHGPLSGLDSQTPRYLPGSRYPQDRGFSPAGRKGNNWRKNRPASRRASCHLVASCHFLPLNCGESKTGCDSMLRGLMICDTLNRESKRITARRVRWARKSPACDRAQSVPLTPSVGHILSSV